MSGDFIRSKSVERRIDSVIAFAIEASKDPDIMKNFDWAGRMELFGERWAFLIRPHLDRYLAIQNFVDIEGEFFNFKI